MISNPFRTAIVGAIAACVLTPAPLQAQELPWFLYEDGLSTSACDLVNTTDLELVVRNNGSLEIVTDLDALLSHTFVDAEGFVFFDGLLVGVVEFAEDADGFRTLWLLTLSGTVLDIDPITGDPLATNFFPSDFSDVPCDACDFADGPVGCDGDLDGVDDALDLCPSTPLDVFVDIDGCACFELDGDGDGVDDCDDLCPGSTTAFVDVAGCGDSSTGPVVVSCGAIGAIMMMLGFCGLSTMRFSRRRL